MKPKCQITKGVLSRVVKMSIIEGESSMGESYWGVTAIYIDINQCVHSFNR